MAKEYKSKTPNNYGVITEGPRKAPKPGEAHDMNSIAYDPQGSGMGHDPFFAEVCPTVANSGNLAHKWGGEGEHVTLEVPPQDLAGD